MFGKVFPAIGVGLLFGNLFYLAMARITAFKQSRTDMTALPYGVNTPAMYAFLFAITMAEAGANPGPEDIARAYYTTVAANLICGILTVVAAPFAHFIQKHTPVVALLSCIAGIALAYLVLANVVTALAEPAAGSISIMIVLVGMYSLKVTGQIGPIPVTIIAMIWGSAICWIQGGCTCEGSTYQTVDAVRDSFEKVKWYGVSFPMVHVINHIGRATHYIGYILPIALQTITGTVTAVELAKSSGDEYNVSWSMFGDGMGTILASCCGSTLSMTTYPNHPGFKKLGGLVGYSWVTGVAIFIMTLFGILSPFLAIFSIHSILPGIIFVGVMIISAAMRVCEGRYYLAFIVGVLPSLADWGKNIASDRLPLEGLSQGNLVIGLIWAAMLYYVIDRRFLQAAVWSCVAIFMSFVGLIHSSKLGAHVSGVEFKYVLGYIQICGVFMLCYVAQLRELIDWPPAEEDPWTGADVSASPEPEAEPIKADFEKLKSPLGQQKVLACEGP